LDKMRQERFDLFITGDRNLQFQQHFPATGVAVVVLRAGSTRLAETLPLMKEVLNRYLGGGKKRDQTTDLRGIENSDAEYNLVSYGSHRPPHSTTRGLMHRNLLLATAGHERLTMHKR
jgi:hypothetical protein